MQDGKQNPILKAVIDLGAFLVPMSWVVCRFYYYPIFGLQIALEMPPYLVFTILVIFLLLIFTMSIIWGVVCLLMLSSYSTMIEIILLFIALDPVLLQGDNPTVSI